MNAPAKKTSVSRSLPGVNAQAAPICDFDPSVDKQEFRRALSQFATGVTVVTTVFKGRPVAMTANSFSSLSLTPPLILWSISKTSSRFESFDTAQTFVVNVLSDRQIDLSRHFATAGDDRFNDVEWEAGWVGSPILHGAAAVFECRRVGHYDGGDHRILVGEVSRAIRFDRAPLLFSQGGYRVPADHPEDTSQRSLDSQPPEAGDMEGTLLQDLFRANHRLAAAFVQYRGSLTRDEHRALISVERRPGLTTTELADHSFLGARAAEDAVGSLLGQRLLSQGAQGGLTLTDSGRFRRSQLVGHLQQMEREVFAGVPIETLRAGRELLRFLASD